MLEKLKTNEGSETGLTSSAAEQKLFQTCNKSVQGLNSLWIMGHNPK